MRVWPRPKPKGGSISLRTPSKILLTAASTCRRRLTICSGVCRLAAVADGSKDDRGGRPPHAICLGLRLGEESLRAVLAYGFDTMRLTVIVAGHGLGHDNSQKLLERVGFGYTHNIMWGPKAIEVRMYAIDAGMGRLTGTRESA